MLGLNTIYSKRGLEFNLDDYPDNTKSLLSSKIQPVEEIISALPKSFQMISTFAMGAPRGLLRKLSIRKDYQSIGYKCAMTLEPYPFLKYPNVHITSAYFSPLDRFLVEKMGKSVAHLPRQFLQFSDYVVEPGRCDYYVHACSPPDADGFVNLGVNCETVQNTLDTFAERENSKIILEINPHMPWVMGTEKFNYNRFHISKADGVYVNSEPLPQIPLMKATEVEKRIGEIAQRYVEDGDTLQLGIGGVPTYVAQHLKSRRSLKIHSEMITDGIMELAKAGAIDSRGKAIWDKLMIGSFVAGTSALYDWVDRNPDLRLVPIHACNEPTEIGRNKRLKSINSALMVDLNGQVCSDAVGFKQVSGIGGQLEFVMGAQRSEGGRSLLCLKSTRELQGKRISSICLTLPPGSPVTVPRHYADVIITEYGAAEIRSADAQERAQALVAIAHPDFRHDLIKEAMEAGLWKRQPGFQRFSQRAIYNNFGTVYKLKKAIEKDPSDRVRILFQEAKTTLMKPDLPGRVKRFYYENRSL